MIVPDIELFGINIVTFLVDFGGAYALLLAVSLSLNLEAGYAGVPNFGKVLFVAGGAVLAGSVSGRLSAFILGVPIRGDYNGNTVSIVPQLNSYLKGHPVFAVEILLVTLILAGIIGGVLGFAASFPAIRLREDYLGMLLLASAQLFQIILRGYSPLIGGTQGINVPNLFAWVDPQGVEKGLRNVAILTVAALFALGVYWYSETIARSPLGRTLRAVRDNEVASRALGKDDVAIRRKVIIIASAISAVAGALLTFQNSTVTADTWTRLVWTFLPWLVMIIGGTANNLGVALGAFSYTFFNRYVEINKFQIQPFVPIDVNWLEYLVFSAILIGILVLRPGGIVPEKSSSTLPPRTVARIISVKDIGSNDVPRSATNANARVPDPPDES